MCGLHATTKNNVDTYEQGHSSVVDSKHQKLLGIARVRLISPGAIITTAVVRYNIVYKRAGPVHGDFASGRHVIFFRDGPTNHV